MRACGLRTSTHMRCGATGRRGAACTTGQQVCIATVLALAAAVARRLHGVAGEGRVVGWLSSADRLAAPAQFAGAALERPYRQLPSGGRP